MMLSSQRIKNYQMYQLVLCLLLLCTRMSDSQSFLDIPIERRDLETGRDNSTSSAELQETAIPEELVDLVYEPHSPLVLCNFLSNDFIVCEPPLDLHGNKTLYDELHHGCFRWGGRTYNSVQKTAIRCRVLRGIECFGNRTFLRPGYPCVHYSNHYFLTNLLYSLLLGFLGIDRFCLGHTGTAVGKLLTIGGLGFWWMVDVVLLIRGELNPADGSNWAPMY